MVDTAQRHMTNRNVQIGNICSQFAHLELLLAQAIWSVLKLKEETGLVVTGSLGIEARSKMAVELCKKLGAPDEVVSELKNVRKNLQALKIVERRNHAIHGHRFPDPDDPAAEFVIIHRGKNAGIKIKRADGELAKIGTDIADLHKPLYKAMVAAGMTY